MSRFLSRPRREVAGLGRTWKVPVLYQSVRLMEGLFICDLEVARSLMPSRRITPLSPLPKCGIVGISCFEYASCDVAPYNEVGITIGVRVDHPRMLPTSPYCLAKSILAGTYHGFVADLPVTTQEACDAGVHFFSYPKWVGKISFSETTSTRTCVVTDPATNEVAYSFTGMKFPKTQCKSLHGSEIVKFRTFTVMDKELLETSAEMNPKMKAQRWCQGGMFVHPGSSSRSQLLKSLNLGTLMQYTYIPEGEMSLDLPQPIGPADPSA